MIHDKLQEPCTCYKNGLLRHGMFLAHVNQMHIERNKNLKWSCSLQIISIRILGNDSGVKFVRIFFSGCIVCAAGGIFECLCANVQTLGLQERLVKKVFVASPTPSC